MFDFKTLKSLLEAKNLTQKQLAEQTRIPKQSISYYMKGMGQPPADRVQLIADALGVSVDVFCSEIAPQGQLLLTVREAAEMLGIPEKDLKEGIIKNQWNPAIGSAIRGKRQNYRFHIPKRRVEIYLGL